MSPGIPRERLRSLLVSPYLVYPAGIVAIVLIYTLAFLLLQDNFHVPGGRPDLFTALYYVVISMTTTGYGDIYPVTLLGKLFSMLVVITGLMILFAVVLPLMVTPIMERLLKSPRIRMPDWVNDHVIICGYNAIVDSLVVELADLQKTCVVIDPDLEHVLALQRQGHYALVGDASDEDTLKAARIARAKYLIANAGDERNAAIVLTASQIADCKIIALVESLDMAHYLEFAGADIVASPKQMLGANMAQTAILSIDFEISSAVDLGGDVKICKLPVYPDNPLVGKKLKDVDLRRATGANVVALFKNGDFVVNPAADVTIDEATVLVVTGTEDQLKNAGHLSQVKTSFCDGHCIIAGFGDVGREVARRFDSKGIQYTVIDRRQYDIRNQVIGDSANKDALLRAGIEKASTVVVTLNDDAKNMLTILLARNLNPHINILARANLNSSVPKMYRAGADFVTSLSALGGQILARIVERGVLEDAVLLSENVLLYRFAVKGSRVEGKTIKETGMRSRTGCTILGIREGESFKPSPDPAEVLSPEATIVTVGTARQLEACAAAFGLRRLAD